MLQERVEPSGGDVAEGGWQSMLQPGSCDKKSLAMGFAEGDERGNDGVQIRMESENCRTQLKNQSGIKSVLAGGSEMNVTGSLGRIAGDHGIELLQQRDGEIPCGRHGLRQGRQVNQLYPTG